MRVVINEQRAVSVQVREVNPVLRKVLKDYATIRNQMIAINKIAKHRRTKGISRGEGYERTLYKILMENGIDVPEPVMYKL